MVVGTKYDEEEVSRAIADSLDHFYTSLIEKIDSLDVINVRIDEWMQEINIPRCILRYI